MESERKFTSRRMTLVWNLWSMFLPCQLQPTLCVLPYASRCDRECLFFLSVFDFVDSSDLCGENRLLSSCTYKSNARTTRSSRQKLVFSVPSLFQGSLRRKQEERSISFNGSAKRLFKRLRSSRLEGHFILLAYLTREWGTSSALSFLNHLGLS